MFKTHFQSQAASRGTHQINLSPRIPEPGSIDSDQQGWDEVTAGSGARDGRLIKGLRALVDDVLAEGAWGPAAIRPHLHVARTRLASDLTVVVGGRRGVGKTSLINRLAGPLAAPPGYTAADQPVQVFTSQRDPHQSWATTTQMQTPFLQGRRLVELPEHVSDQDADVLTRVTELSPDVVVYVAQHELRSDELGLLHRLQGEWMLGPLDVMVVLVDPVSVQFASESTMRLTHLKDRILARHRGLFAQVALGGTRSAQVIGALAVAEAYAGARRAGEAMQQVTDLAARCDDRAWSGRVLDNLERVALSPQAHIWRELWAVEECLRGTTQLPTELLADLLEFYLPDREGSQRVEEPRSADVAQRAHRWRSAGNRLPPRAAEVARIVVRSCQLQMTQVAPTPASLAAQVISTTPEARHVVV
jgi:hypothetical protein